MSRTMKDSGIPWIGEIPSHWNTERIKTIFSERVELSENGSEDLLSVSEYYGVDKRAGRVDEGDYVSRSESLVGYKKCHKGDIVSNIMLAWKGSLGVSEYAGVVSPAYCVYKPSESVYPKYYHYLFRTSLYTGRFRCFSKGIIDSRLRLYSPYFFDIEAIIPPREEQLDIADFLDKKCGEIDQMVSLQERIIEELKAYKQSVITEAVTKGLNPNVPMRDSGIEWIGLIPDKWSICRIKDVLETGKDGIKIGPFGSSLTGKVNGTGQYKIYGQWNIVGKDFAAGQNYVDSDTFVELSSYKVIPGDVLISMMGTIGKCTIIPTGIQQGIMDSHVIKVRLNKNVCFNAFFEYIYDKDFSSFVINQLQRVKKGSIMDGLNSSTVKNLYLILPPVDEQQAIADYLDTKCAEIDALISLKQSKIESLKEYKKSIIYEYVTGKKSVNA